MKLIRFLIIVFVAISMNMSCSAQADRKKENTTTVKNDKVEVFYFHYTRRCATCQAVEKVTKETVQELYGNKISFEGVNLDEPDGEIKGHKLGISGQTLLIKSGDTKINLTNEGFMYARSNPEKLKEIIQEKVDPLI